MPITTRTAPTHPGYNAVSKTWLTWEEQFPTPFTPATYTLSNTLIGDAKFDFNFSKSVTQTYTDAYTAVTTWYY